MKAPIKLQIKFRGASLDIYVESDGFIDTIENNGQDVTSLMFDLELTGDIQTEAMTAFAQYQIESAQLSKQVA